MLCITVMALGELREANVILACITVYIGIVEA